MPSIPQFGGTFYYLPNIAESTARLYKASMEQAVGADRFQMHVAGVDGVSARPEGHDAIAYCEDQEVADAFVAKGFNTPESFSDEAVIRGQADSLADAVKRYPKLASQSRIQGAKIAEAYGAKTPGEEDIWGFKPAEKPEKGAVRRWLQRLGEQWQNRSRYTGPENPPRP